MQSRELNEWPNGIRVAYRQYFQCGHGLTIWSNAKDVRPPYSTDDDGNEAWRELRSRVIEMGCLKCENPAEPLNYKHKGRGGFLKNFEIETARNKFQCKRCGLAHMTSYLQELKGTGWVLCLKALGSEVQRLQKIVEKDKKHSIDYCGICGITIFPGLRRAIEGRCGDCKEKSF